MTLSSLSPNAFSRALRQQPAQLAVGPFHVRLYATIASVQQHLAVHYGAFPVVGDDDFIDFDIALVRPLSLRRYYRAQVLFLFEGHTPFKPLPFAQAAAFFEWGLNWCIASHAHRYLMVHAAVVEWQGCGLLLAGAPGSGKSTLCAALVGRGWRLLSDELALVSLDDGLVTPVPRPISLKNQSLAVIRAFCPDAVIGPVVYDTSKGTVGHVRPPDASVIQAQVPVKIRHIVFPKYQAGAVTKLSTLSKGYGLLKLADNSFNYSILGVHGFNAAGDLCDGADCHAFRYSQLEEAVALFAGLCS